MSDEIELSVQDAQQMLDNINLQPDDWKRYARRTDSEKLALGVFCLNLITSKGWTLRKIEAETGIPRATITRYRDFALKSIALPTVDEARKLEIERLEALIEVWYPLALAGDEKGMAAYMKLSSRLGEITGTNKPTQVESVVLDITPQEKALQSLLEDAKRQAELEEMEILEEADE